MKTILIVGGITLVLIFIASVLSTSFLLRVANYSCIALVPISFLTWVYEGIIKSRLLPPQNLSVIFLVTSLVYTMFTFLLTRLYRKRVKKETITQNLDSDSQRNFNYILLMIIGGNIIALGYTLNLLV